MSDSGPTCPWCGQAARVELFEAWDHDFMIDTCCEDAHEELSAQLSGHPSEGARLLRSMQAEALLGHPLRAISDGGGHLILDYRLRVDPLPFAQAREFVRIHHRHCKPPVGWRFGAGCWNGRTLIGVIMVGRPVARMLDAHTIVEVNRLCLDFTQPAPLRFNAVSKLLSYAAREARIRGFSRIITYTLGHESGHSLRASGWTPTRRSRGGSWSRKRRPRNGDTPESAKQRWERVLAC